VKGSVAASPAAWVLESTPCVVELLPLPRGEPGFEPGVVVVVVGVVVVVVVLVVVVVGVGPGSGFGFGVGSGVGFGFGLGSGVLPHFALFLPLSACTSTSWPPEQGVAL
jgi:hypothetical protein